MTPDELRAIQDAATEGPWVAVIEDDREAYIADVMTRPEPFGDGGITDADATLIALAPTLADLVLEMAEALAWQAEFASQMREHTGFVHVERRSRTALAKLDEVEAQDDVAVVREALPGLRNLIKGGYSYGYALNRFKREQGFDAIDWLDRLDARVRKLERAHSDCQKRNSTLWQELNGHHADALNAQRENARLREVLERLNRLAGQHDGITPEAFEALTDIIRAALTEWPDGDEVGR